MLEKYSLERLPKTTKGDLRAWDAADELLLNHLFENHLSNVKSPILIINDSFGALAIALHKHTTHSWSDSRLAHLATQENLEKNNLKSDITMIPSTKDLTQSYDVVVIKIPKTLDLLEDQLFRLKAHVTTDTVIIASAMSKHIHTSTLKLFEKLIGTTTTSRATKKARLIFSKSDNEAVHSSPFPKIITDESLDLILSNHANVFSKDRLDIGSRFLIDQLKHCPASQHIVDLGCGNGVLGIMASRLQPQAHLSFIDESYAAVRSTKENHQRESKNKKDISASFYNSDSFNQFSGKGVDLILCNPPFHQNHSIGDHIAWQMLKQSYDQLENNGEIWVVGNRHLAYHVKLNKLFGNCTTVASNKKFVVLRAVKCN